MADLGQAFKIWSSALIDGHLDNLSMADFGRWAKWGTYVRVHGNRGVITLHAPQKTLCSILEVQDFAALVEFLRRVPHATVVTNDGVTSTTEPESEAPEATEGNVDAAVTPVTDEIVTPSVSVTIAIVSPVTVTFTFHNWQKYQGDNSADRVKAFRARKKATIDVGSRSRKRSSQKQKEVKTGQDPPETSAVFKPFRSPQSFFVYWNTWKPKECPAVDLTVESRIKKTAAVLKKFPKEEFWVQVFKNLNESEFLRGLHPSPDHPNWKASFDWLVLESNKRTRVENCVAVYEGHKYLGPSPSAPNQRAHSTPRAPRRGPAYVPQS